MASLMKPLPALYTVYVLRSTVRHASLYVGSTPNPPRRLKQHNGEAKGGAARTSRNKLRPWEMVVILSGFPSMVAALQFEWALANPHLTLHIPKESRLAKSTQRKKNGMPRRPAASLESVVSNIHLLIGVPAFARWPLNLHFFSETAHDKWNRWLSSKDLHVRDDLKIMTDFGSQEDDSSAPLRGIDALPLDYKFMKQYVEKAHNVVSFEREGDCVLCREEMKSNEGLYPMCPNGDCEAMGHLDCWSKHALAGEASNAEAMIPKNCKCPSCGGQIHWGDMMKELSLRMRGATVVEKLLKKPRRRKAKEVASVSDDEDEDDDV